MKQLISSRNIKVVLAVVLAITCINGIGLNLNDHPIQVPDGTSSPQSKTTSTSSIPDYTGLASVVLSDGSGLDISDDFEAKGVRMTRKYRLERTAFIGCRNTAYMDVDDAEPCPFCGSRQVTIYPYGKGTTS